MKRILFWDNVGTGHHIEYLEHLYSLAQNDIKNKYIFYINSDIIRKSSIDWEESENLVIEIQQSVDKSIFKQLIDLLKRIKHYSPDVLFLIRITDIIPVVLLFPLFFRRVKVSGILYHIYLYNWKETPIRKKIRDILIFCIYKLPAFDRILVLNDKASTGLLNKKWRTNKYCYLPDPLSITNEPLCRDLRKELTISPESIVYLHCGSLDERKGTIKILKAINELEEDKETRAYLFVGVVNKAIKDEYNRLIEDNNKKHRIITNNKFVEVEELCNYVNACDCILLPYRSTAQSSGIIAFASHYNKYVAGPRGGLLGHLIKKYNLGGFIEPSVSGLMHFIKEFKKSENEIKRNNYSNTHRREDFLRVIKEAID